MHQLKIQLADVRFSWTDNFKWKKWLGNCLTMYKVNHAHVSYVFCSDHFLLQLNQKHLNHNYYTDIITFDLSDNLEQIDGECYISLTRVRDNAAVHQHPFGIELCRVMIHGILHLIGYEDNSPDNAALMREQENACLSLLNNVPRGTFEVQKE